MIAENVENICERIRNTCAKVGRNPNDVLFVAVSKTFSSDKVAQAVRSGVYDIGENFVQELTKKRNQLNDPRIRWHFVGHLQTNKMKYIAKFIHLIHSVENLRVAEEINKRAIAEGRTIDVLIEVNTSGEATKYGIEPAKTLEFVKSASQFPNVRVKGLMTIGPFLPNPEQSRPAFRLLRELKEKILSEGIEHVEMQHLSMGMTNDFEVAVEEGSTIVRLGTAIFGPRTKRTNPVTL